MSQTIFSAVSLYSLLGVLAILLVAERLASIRLPQRSAKDKAIYVWLCFDALIHFVFEGSFLYYSTFGRTAQTSDGMFAAMWREYAKADARWGTADPTVVSLEILTVLGAGPLCVYLMSLLETDRWSRHFWIVVLSTAELYGGWMTFCPEWLTGSPALNTDNWLHLWVYLFFMNTIWVWIPLWLLYDAYGNLSTRPPSASSVRKTNKKIS